MAETKRMNFGMTDEEFIKWLGKFPEPKGCLGCGAIAGCCKDYPNCAGGKQCSHQE